MSHEHPDLDPNLKRHLDEIIALYPDKMQPYLAQALVAKGVMADRTGRGLSFDSAVCSLSLLMFMHASEPTSEAQELRPEALALRRESKEFAERFAKFLAKCYRRGCEQTGEPE